MIDSIYDLIKNVSTILPPDVEKQIKNIDGHLASVMKDAIKISKDNCIPICQDTGYPYFLVKLPFSQTSRIKEINLSIEKALLMATEDGLIRPNSVDPIRDRNYGNNLGEYLPYVDFEFQNRDDIEINLLLKGGGSENVSNQYSIPNDITSERSIEGVKKIILYHLTEVQGLGCAPGIIGVCIGGDRALGYKIAKKQLFRSLDDKNKDPIIAELESQILEKANSLNIGPMGLGGSPTLLGVKIGFAARHPASFFVTISYLCWVARRGKCNIK